MDYDELKNKSTDILDEVGTHASDGARGVIEALTPKAQPEKTELDKILAGVRNLASQSHFVTGEDDDTKKVRALLTALGSGDAALAPTDMGSLMLAGAGMGGLTGAITNDSGNALHGAVRGAATGAGVLGGAKAGLDIADKYYKGHELAGALAGAAVGGLGTNFLTKMLIG